MNQPQEKLSLLRTILKTLGLSADAIDDIVQRIIDFLTERDGKSEIEYPYAVRGDFLSPAEQSFYFVLKSAVSEWAWSAPRFRWVTCLTSKTVTPVSLEHTRIRLTASMWTFCSVTRRPRGQWSVLNSMTEATSEVTDNGVMSSFRMFSRRRACRLSKSLCGLPMRLWN